MAFFVDVALGPVSGLIFLGAFVIGNAGRPWAIVLGVTAALNLVVSSTILLTVGDGIAPLGALIGLQAIISAFVLVVVTRRPWRAAVFGWRGARG